MQNLFSTFPFESNSDGPQTDTFAAQCLTDPFSRNGITIEDVNQIFQQLHALDQIIGASAEIRDPQAVEIAVRAFVEAVPGVVFVVIAAATDPSFRDFSGRVAFMLRPGWPRQWHELLQQVCQRAIGAGPIGCRLSRYDVTDAMEQVSAASKPEVPGRVKQFHGDLPFTN